MCGGQGRGRVSTRGSHLCLCWCDAPCPASQCLKASPSSLAGCRLPLPRVGEHPAAKGTHPAPHLGKPQAGGSSAQPWDPLRSLLRAGSRRWEPGCLAPWGALQRAAALLRHGTEMEHGRLSTIYQQHPGASSSHAGVLCLDNCGGQLPAGAWRSWGQRAGLLWRHASVPRVLSHLSGVLFLCCACKLFACSPLGFGRGKAAVRCHPAAPGVPPRRTYRFLSREAKASIQCIPNHACLGPAHISLWLSWS